VGLGFCGRQVSGGTGTEGDGVVAEHGDQPVGFGFLYGVDRLVVAMSARRVAAFAGTDAGHTRRFGAGFGQGDVNDMVVRADGCAYVGQMGRAYERKTSRPRAALASGYPRTARREVTDDLRCATAWL